MLLLFSGVREEDMSLSLEDARDKARSTVNTLVQLEKFFCSFEATNLKNFRDLFTWNSTFQDLSGCEKSG